MELSGWGRYPCHLATVQQPHDISEALPPLDRAMIARGQGRSYGDATLSTAGIVMLTDRLSRSVSFDEQTGLLTAQAGATLAAVIEEFLPRGWFPAVVPGTKIVSLGGCVAADIHGKNHHRDGAFGAQVKEIEIVTSDRSRRRCSAATEAPLFWATVGGMGLTGLITEVALQLMPVESAYVMVQHHAARDLDQCFEMLSASEWDDQYTVAWIDCLAKGAGGADLGRGVLMRGHHANLGELSRRLRERPFAKARGPYTLGFDFPAWVLNATSVRVFNELYFHLQSRRTRPFIAHYDSFFFPLDRLGNWNRMYGKRGFVQYQCVLPTATARTGMRDLLAALNGSGQSSFLSVLKRFGPAGQGLLSFPIEGYTLTLDLPVQPALFPLLDRLDAIVLENGGRVYLAKDARLKPETFRRMYPRLAEWLAVKQQVDSDNQFDSDLARRLELVNSE